MDTQRHSYASVSPVEFLLMSRRSFILGLGWLVPWSAAERPLEAQPIGSVDPGSFVQGGAKALERPSGDKMGEVLSITDFGASASASAASNNVAIAAAFSAAQSRKCGVYVPGTDGVYEVSDEFAIPLGVLVFGDGWGSRVRQTAADKNIFTLGTFSAVDQLHLIGKKSGATDFAKNGGIFADGVGNFSVSRCFIEGFEGSGVDIRRCHDFRIVDNFIFGNVWSSRNGGVDGASTADILLYSAQANSARIIISRNHCLSNNSQGIYADALGGNADIVISDNVCVALDPETCTEGGEWREYPMPSNASSLVRRHGIVIGYTNSSVGGPRAVLSNNVCRNTLWTGIYKEGVAAGPVLITGNICSKNGFGAANPLSGGIFAYVDGYEQICGNWVFDFRNNDVSGVGGITLIATVVPSARSSIKNNVIRGSAAAGICMGTNAGNCDLVENTVVDSAYSDIIASPNAGVPKAGGHLIERNKIVRSNTAHPAIDIWQQSSTLITRIVQNTINGAGAAGGSPANSAVRVSGGDPKLTHVAGNFIENFHNGYYSGSAWRGREFDAILEDNVINECTRGFVVRGLTPGVTVPLVNNRFIRVAHHTHGDGYYSVGRICVRKGLKLGADAVNSPPSEGSWTQGDWVDYTAPVSGGYRGAICVSDGTPGMWRTFGRVS